MKKKKILVNILNIVIISSMLFTQSITANAAANWGGTTIEDSAISFESGSGSAPAYGVFKNGATTYTKPWSLEGAVNLSGVAVQRVEHESEPGYKVYSYLPTDHTHIYSAMPANGVASGYTLAKGWKWNETPNESPSFADGAQHGFVNSAISTSFKGFKTQINGYSYNWPDRQILWPGSNSDSSNGYQYVVNNGTWNDTILGKGEYRYYGYSTQGLAISNTCFPADIVSRYEPNVKKDRAWDDISSNEIKSRLTKYDDMGITGAYQIKYDAIASVITGMYGVADKNTDPAQFDEDVKYFMNKLSLRTNPKTDAPVLMGWTYKGEYYSTFMGKGVNSPNLVLTYITVLDSDNKVVGTFKRDMSNNGSITENIASKVVPGNTYTVQYTVYNDGKGQSPRFKE